jgi:hypothetical protein
MVAALALALVACGLLFAQPNIPVRPDQLPGRPPQMALPSAQTPAAEQAPIAVVPGPDPKYTLFGTSEVIGYVEPCG